VYPKKINGRIYYYLREMGWVEGKPKMISERYLGTAEAIAAALEAQDAAGMPDRTRHLGFGDVAAVWGLLSDLGVAGVVDDVVGVRRADAGASAGTYLALAALNRVVAPCSKAGFADWWAATAADRFTKITSSVLGHRKFWEAMRMVTLAELEVISHRLAVRMITMFGLGVSSVALDMTNFATHIDSANDKALIAVRGKAKQKRFDLRLVGLGLVVTRDGGIPLTWHAYPGNKPDVTQFAGMIDQLGTRYTAIAAQTRDTPADPGTAAPGWAAGAGMTVVFDAGQNCVANFDHLHEAELHFVGSIPPSDCPDLLAVPASRRRIVDAERFEGLSAFETRRTVYERDRRVILTHSPTLHSGQAHSFEHTTLAKATRKLDDLAATLARGKTRRARAAVEADIMKITADPWVRRVITWELTGDTPTAHRLTWAIDDTARTALETEIFGKRILLTDHDDWPIGDVVAAYRSQSDAEFSFRQLKDPHVVSFAPMHHWTEHNIRVHVFTCVLALQIAHLMRRQAHHAGLKHSVRDLLDTLTGIQETVLIYPSTGGRPKARRLTTDMTPAQQNLHTLYTLQRWAPAT
jgi:transposase